MWVLLDCGTPNVPRHQCYFAWFECRRLCFLPCCRAAGAVLSLRTRALLTGHITQVALSMTHVLSCRRRTTVKQCVFSPEKINFKITLCFLQCLPFFFNLFISFVMSLLTSFFLSFFFTWVTWVVVVMCPSCTNYQQPVVFVFTSLKVQLIILKLLTPPAQEQLLCLLSSSLCPVFISCANTLRRFRDKTLHRLKMSLPC